MTPLLLILPALLAAKPDVGVSLDARAAVSAGAFDGAGVRTDSGQLLTAEVELDPRLRRGAWTFELPLEAKHTETFGAELPETLYSARADAEYRASRFLTLGLDAGIQGAYRPGWPDLYQRQPGGTLLETDRYGYFGWRSGARVTLAPARHQQLRLGYGLRAYDYVNDAGFDAVLDPNHLTPRDNLQQHVDLSWRYHQRAWELTVGIDYAYRADGEQHARNAGTGSTAGGTNPLQRLHEAEPGLQLELEPFDGRLDLTVGYGYQVQNDPFAGYYSYSGHHPRLAARITVTEKLSATARVEAWLREYGDDGTSATRLESGDRRNDRRTLVRGGLRYAFTEALGVFGEAEWVNRTTNYPDDVPDPMTDEGAKIDWDYVNLTALAGVEWRR
jgi:hypothetical protein